MKMLVLVLSLLGSIAFAELKPPGTFVATQCASSASGEVCFGFREGVSGQFMSVAIKRSTPTIFRVVKRTPGNAGINPSFAVETVNLVSDSNYKASATIYSTNGAINHVDFKVANEVVAVDKFNFVVTTM